MLNVVDKGVNMKSRLPLIIVLFALILILSACSGNPSADIPGDSQGSQPEPEIMKYSREYWGEWKKMDQTETWEITSTWIKVNGKYLSRDVVLAKPSENVISVTDGKITYCLYAVRTASSLISGSVESDDGARGVGGWLPVVVQNINDRFDVTETTTNGEGVFSADKLIPGDEYKITIGDTSLTVTPSFDGEDIGNITLRDGVNFKVSLSNGNDIMFAGSDYYSMNLIIENIGDANCTAATYSLTADEGLEFINSYSEGVLLRTVAAGEKKTIPLRVRCNIPETETAIRKLHLTITDRNGTTWNDSVSLKFYKNTITINVISENGRPISGVIIGEGRTYSITNKTNYSIEVPVSPESYLMVFSGAIANASSNTEAAYSIGLDCPAIEADELLKELGTDVNNFEPNDDEIHAQTLLLGKSMVAYLFENDIDYYYLEPFHEWDEGRVIREATCTEDGLKVSTCLICGRTAELAIPATGHDWDEGKVTKEATCTEDGLKVSTCSVCGKTEETAISAFGHDWDGGIVTKKATCTDDGLKVCTCSVCGATEEITIPSHGHDWSKWTTTVVMTCTEDGLKVRTCSVCGETGEEVLHSSGHQWNGGVETKTASCTEEGTKLFTCTVCGETRTESIPVQPDAHAFDEDHWTTDTDYHWHAATCGHDVKSDYGLHSWNSGVITVAPTHQNAGTKTYTCTTCGLTRTETLPAQADAHTFDEVNWTSDSDYHWHAATCGHNVVKDKAAHTWVQGSVKAATCTTNGSVTYTCSVCEATKTETIPAYGHSFSTIWSSDSNYHWHAATCGHSVVSDKTAHTWEYVSGTLNSCTEAGSAIYRCKVCGATKTETLPALGHSWDSGVVTAQPSSGEGVKTYTCIFCGSTKTESYKFSVGTIGPAGGYIFYDKGFYSDGWRYLEAAPSDIKQGSDYSFKWGDVGSFGTQTGIGTGKSNTNLIVSKASKSQKSNAATLCDDYVFGGYDDWFLPSRDELNLMYVNLYKAGQCGFIGYESGYYIYYSYWSSSEHDRGTNYAWSQIFVEGQESYDGWQFDNERNGSCRVRPIRAF